MKTRTVVTEISDKVTASLWFGNFLKMSFEEAFAIVDGKLPWATAWQEEKLDLTVPLSANDMLALRLKVKLLRSEEQKNYGVKFHFEYEFPQEEVDFINSECQKTTDLGSAFVWLAQQPAEVRNNVSVIISSFRQFDSIMGEQQQTPTKE